jgi:hypothetical protein
MATSPEEVADLVRAYVSDANTRVGALEVVAPTSAIIRPLPSLLELLRKRQERWIFIAEVANSCTRYVQVLATEEHGLFAECISNEFLHDEDRLSPEQEELLPLLGWEWPAPPNKPNWTFHDELLDTGSAVGRLLAKTVSQVFGLVESDEILIKVLRSATKRRDDPQSSGRVRPEAPIREAADLVQHRDTEIGVAPEGAPYFPDINEFALTFNAYDRVGDFHQVSRIANDAAAAYRASGVLPAGLDTLRTTLFFEQRRYRHFDRAPVGSELDYVEALVREIRRLSGGTLPGPADPHP